MRPVRSTSPIRRAVAVTLGAGLLAGVALAVTGASASAAVAAKTHDPVGEISTVKSVAGGVQLTGWAYDPDAKTADTYLVAELDGATALGSVTTTVANPAVTRKYGLGPTPGYSLVVTVPTGRHTVCMVARNQGAGVSTPIGCVPLPVGSSWTSAQIAARQPRGKVTQASATRSSVTFAGFATDPDWTAAHLRAVLYVDDSAVATVYTSGAPSPAVSGAGSNSAFSITAPVSAGTHVGCVWIVNVGAGDANTFLGCTPVDTRGPAGTGPLPSPAVNKAVTTEALKHRGQPYSWGATGPSSFDCSGLVLYSYRKAVAAVNKTLPAAQQSSLVLPRISEDQARAARLVPASRVVPGDLVFTFDSQGDVYHVGIYVKPGQAFAAIDYGYGVNYQNIWDPTMTMYGSFTHT